MTRDEHPPTGRAVDQIAPVVEEIRQTLAELRVLATEMRETDERPPPR